MKHAPGFPQGANHHSNDFFEQAPFYFGDLARRRLGRLLAAQQHLQHRQGCAAIQMEEHTIRARVQPEYDQAGRRGQLFAKRVGCGQTRLRRLDLRLCLEASR
jgi:hypothetical protein